MKTTNLHLKSLLFGGMRECVNNYKIQSLDLIYTLKLKIIMACDTTVFGPSSQYIKLLGGDFVAIQGANTVEKLITSDLKIPYSQILKSKIILKPGQVNYLLNHLGLGDNATFLLVKATYDTLSVIEEDNYVQYSYYDDLTKSYYMDQLLLLTGNSTHRVKQLYLTNPNVNYAVTLEVMAASIDDSYSSFPDIVNQSGTSFVNLNYTDIKTYVVGQSVVVYDKHNPPLPLIYVELSNINSIQKMGTIVIINDSTLGSIFLQFVTEFDAYQAQSLLNYVINNHSVNINTLNPVGDFTSPVVYFWSNVGNTYSGDFIAFNGLTSGVPYNTNTGYTYSTFSTSISLSTFGSASIIDKSMLSNLLIDVVIDNRDGIISLIPNQNINIYNGMLSFGTSSGTSSATCSSPTMSSATMSNISATGSYTLAFDLSDIAQNYVDGVMINLNITT